MKLTFLGTCSGTEPMPGRKHVSFVIEHTGGVYWFDAGEGCSRTAHLAGIDLLSVRAIFITHTHMDHIGGLANLLWTMRKLHVVRPAGTPGLMGRTVKALIPDLDVWNHVLGLLGGTEGGFSSDYTVDAQQVRDGIIYDEEGLRVEALHNLHLGKPKGDWRSFSFRIGCEDRRIVYSGDVRDVQELSPLLDGIDLLLMETGLHRVEEVCHALVEMGQVPGRLGFIHHGREILQGPAAALARARAILAEKVFITNDGMRMIV